MIISLVSAFKEKEGLNLPDSRITQGFVMNLTNNVDPNPLSNDNVSRRVKKYCDKLQGILKTKPGIYRGLQFELDWSISQEKVWLRLQGPLLETLLQLCGKEVKLSVKGNISYRRDYYGNTAKVEFVTSKMEINFPSTVTVAEIPKTESTKGNKQPNFNHDQSPIWNKPFCTDLDVKMSDPKFRNRYEGLQNATIIVILETEDEYLYLENSDLDKLGKMCKAIQMDNILSDVSIVAVNSEGKVSQFSANKCFLAAHSPILKAIFEGEFKESKTNEIRMAYSAECVKALLDYIYTFDFSEAVKNCRLAVELFQAANYYQIQHLETKLAEMILLRGKSWFDIDAAIELFCSAERIEITWSKELKSKAFHVLKSKKDKLRDSASFKKLFTEDNDPAMELCAMAFET